MVKTKLNHKFSVAILENISCSECDSKPNQMVTLQFCKQMINIE